MKDLTQKHQFQAEDFGKVAVLMGGWSAEREVSLKSGAAVLESLKKQGVNAEGVDVGRDILSELKQKEYDRVFIALHGRGGEDGVIQGGLEVIDCPYTGSGVLASSLGMDKLRTKQLWLGADLPTPEFVIIKDESDLSRVVEQLGMPVIIKPVYEGSSIGISKVEDESQLEQAWRVAAECGGEVIAEKWIVGGEYTVAILGNSALPIIRLETPNSFYDYQAKYEESTTQYHCPCGLDSEAEKKMQALAKRAFDVVGAKGWGRVDFMLDGSGQPWLLEINTVPGMTDHSLVPMAARASGLEFDDLVWRILETSMASSYTGIDHGC